MTCNPHDAFGRARHPAFLAGDTQKIYFTAGLSDEAHGLFGSLTAVPEPWTWTLMTAGFGLMGATLRARRRAAARTA